MHAKICPATKAAHFSLKGALAPLTVLEVLSDDLNELDRQLKNKMSAAPLLLKDAPTVVDLCKLPTLAELDLADLVQTLKLRGLAPIGFRATDHYWCKRAKACGLVAFPIRKPQVQSVTHQKENGITPLPSTKRHPKIVTQPVRSGQKIVAPEGDLIVMGSVSAGAEVLATGDIHIYGALRGRALAGIQGNDQSHIFCQQLEAELLAIAGHYKVSDDFDQEYWQAQAHIYLTEGRLIIHKL